MSKKNPPPSLWPKGLPAAPSDERGQAELLATLAARLVAGDLQGGGELGPGRYFGSGEAGRSVMNYRDAVQDAAGLLNAARDFTQKNEELA